MMFFAFSIFVIVYSWMTHSAAASLRCGVEDCEADEVACLKWAPDAQDWWTENRCASIDFCLERCPEDGVELCCCAADDAKLNKTCVIWWEQQLKTLEENTPECFVGSGDDKEKKKCRGTRDFPAFCGSTKDKSYCANTLDSCQQFVGGESCCCTEHLCNFDFPSCKKVEARRWSTNAEPSLQSLRCGYNFVIVIVIFVSFVVMIFG